jgi:hypothetical protein
VNGEVKNQTGETNNGFGGWITHCSWFYMDKFILLSCKNNLYLYKYYIETDEQKMKQKNDLKRFDITLQRVAYKICRLVNNNRYKVASSITHPAQSITSFDCINSLQSSTEHLDWHDVTYELKVWC